MWWGSKEGEPPLQEECVAFVHRQSDPNKPATWHNSTRGMGKNHLGNEGSVFQDLDRVILDEARMQQTHKRSIQDHNFIED
jgi:hypothetical protein